MRILCLKLYSPNNPPNVTAYCLQRKPSSCAIDEVYNITNCKCEAAPEPEEPGCFASDRTYCEFRNKNLGENVFFDEASCQCVERPAEPEPEPEPAPPVVEDNDDDEDVPADEPESPPVTPNIPNKVQIDTGEYGYTVYIDIDGDKGSSTLWEDVFPFYITLSGQVIPAFNTVDGKDVGGSSNEYLQTSVQYERISNTGRRKLDWLSKSVSFREGACKSGFINSSTPYCSGVTEHAECSSAASGSKCTLKTVKPVKFF